MKTNEEIKKAEEVMSKLKDLVKEFNKFKLENKDNPNSIMGISMAILDVLVNNMDDALATVGLLETIKTKILIDANMIESIGDTNYIG